MSAPIRYEKDGYLFEDPIGVIIPWPIAKIDEQGNRIPLSMEEIDAWQDNYLKEHPDVQARLDKIEKDRIKLIEENSKIKPPLVEKVIRYIIKKVSF